MQVRHVTLAVAATLAAAACTPGTPHAARPAATTVAPTTGPTPSARPTTPVPATRPPLVTSPAPADRTDVTMTTAKQRGGRRPYVWTADVPRLHGLAPAADRRANAWLATEVSRRVEEGRRQQRSQGGEVTYDQTAALTEVNDTYVAVELTTSWFPQGAAHQVADVDVYVVARRSGARVELADVFRSDAAALRAISRYARERLPVVFALGKDDASARETVATGTAPTVESFRRVTPLAEGLRVTFAAYQVAPFSEGFPVLDVPWSLLRPYLAITPPGGDANPAYRDGALYYPEQRDGVAKALGGVRPRRLRFDQTFASDGWALGWVGADRVALLGESGYPRTWKLVERGPAAGCTTLPTAVRASFALRC
jgi:hypothetical protein